MTQTQIEAANERKTSIVMNFAAKKRNKLL